MTKWELIKRTKAELEAGGYIKYGSRSVEEILDEFYTIAQSNAYANPAIAENMRIARLQGELQKGG